MSTPPVPVEPGQIWADNDWRADGRTVRVDRIDGNKAICTVLTNRHTAQDQLDQHPNVVGIVDQRGKPTRIRLDRLRPTSTGYRLVQHADGTPAEGASDGE
jgi:hypothetical protein